MNLKKRKFIRGLKHAYLGTLLICSITGTSFGQMQLGDDVIGQSNNQYFGGTVSLSENGNRLAVGVSLNSNLAGALIQNPNQGYVRIYENDGLWTQLGSDIIALTIPDQFGHSVAIAGNGSRVAIGAPGTGANGIVGQVLIYDETSTGWTQVASISGEAMNDLFGYSVSISSDGTRLAVGAPNNDGGGTQSGHVRIYEETATGWQQLHSDIDGEAPQNVSGASVSMSGDGTRVAIGSPRSNGSGSLAGHVRVYEETSAGWSLVHGDIDGEAGNDRSGTAVSLSADGTVVAIGAPINNADGTNAGHVRIFKDDNFGWSQVGTDINGEGSADRFGNSLSIAADGNKVAIGARLNDDGGTHAGQTRIYEFTNCDDWQQIGTDIDGKNSFEYSGRAVSISADGNIVGIGSPQSQPNTRGLARVYTSGPYVDCSAIKGLYRPLTLMPGGEKYELEVITNDPDCCSGSKLTPSFQSYTLTNPYFNFPSSGCYSWRVKTYFSGNCSTEFSEKKCSCDGSSNTGTKSLISESESNLIASKNDALEVSIMPNPASDFVTFSITDQTNKSKRANLRVILLDISGKEVYSSAILLNEDVKIDVSSFDPGMYLYRVIVLDQNTILESEKLIIK